MPEFASYDEKAAPMPRLQVRVEPLTSDDIDVCAHLAAQREGAATPTELARWREAFATALYDPDQLVVIARHPFTGAVIAYGKAGLLRPGERGATGLPDGWYLTGVVVTPEFRRRGIASQLTEARIDALAARADAIYYFAAAVNRASIDLHSRFGFVEVARGIAYPSVTFTGGEGILFAYRARPQEV